MKGRIKFIAVLLSLFVLIQSCKVYHRESVSLEEAVRSRTRVKIETNKGAEYKFKRVVFEDGVFYGVNKSKGEIVKTLLEFEELKKVRTKNRFVSSFGTFGIVFAAVFVSLATFYVLFIGQTIGLI